MNTLFQNVFSFDERENDFVDLRIQPPSNRIHCLVECSVENSEKYRTRIKSVYGFVRYKLKALKMGKMRTDRMKFKIRLKSARLESSYGAFFFKTTL